MLREIYTREPSDPLYQSETLEITSELENLLGQIRMLLYTRKGEVMGFYDFGINIEDEIFTFELSQSQLQKKVTESIYQYCPDAGAYDVKVDVQFFKGNVRDICLIDILIDGTKRMGILVK